MICILVKQLMIQNFTSICRIGIVLLKQQSDIRAQLLISIFEFNIFKSGLLVNTFEHTEPYRQVSDHVAGDHVVQAWLVVRKRRKHARRRALPWVVNLCYCLVRGHRCLLSVENIVPTISLCHVLVDAAVRRVLLCLKAMQGFAHYRFGLLPIIS